MRRGNEPGKRTTVLSHIATSGPRTEYQLYNELKMSHGTIHYALKKLAQEGLLKPTQRKRARAVRKAIMYHLTDRGLLTVLASTSDSGTWKKIVEAWRNLCPKILLNWRQLSTRLGNKYLKNKIMSTAAMVLSERIPPPYRVRLGEPVDYVDLFNTVFLNPFLVEGGRPEREHLVRALGRVPDLKSEASQKLRFFERAYSSMADDIKHLQRVLELQGSATSKPRRSRSRIALGSRPP